MAFGRQHCLLAVLEKQNQTVDNGQIFGALLTDLSKAFACHLHELFIAKLNAYDFSLKVLKLKNNYLFQINQRKKINESIVARMEKSIVFSFLVTMMNLLVHGSIFFLECLKARFQDLFVQNISQCSFSYSELY